MKNIIQFLIIMIFLVSLSLVSSAESYDVKNGDSFGTPIGVFTATFYQGDGSWRASIRSPGTTILLDDEECDFQDVYEICFKGITSTEHDPEKDIDIATGVVEFNVIQPEIIREIDSSNLFVGEEAKITVKMIAPDNARIPIKYEDFWPSEFQVQSRHTAGFDVIGNKVIYDGTLRGEEQFEYRIVLLEPTEAEVKARVYYGENEVLETNSISIKTKSILSIKADVSENDPQLGQEINMSVEIENDGDTETLEVTDFKILFPAGLKILDFDSRLEQEANTLVWEGDEISNDINFDVSFRAEKYGNYKIEFSGRAVGGGKEEEAFVTEEIDLTPEELRLNMVFPRVITRPDSVSIRAGVENTDDEVSFQNLRCQLEGLYNKDFEIPRINAGQEINIIDESVSLEDPSPRKEVQKYSCSYQTPNGQSFSVSVDKEVEIQEIDRDSLIEGEGDSSGETEVDESKGEDSASNEDNKDETAESENTEEVMEGKESSGGFFAFFKAVWNSIIGSLFG